ncbi:MAG: hydroxymethylglutaryl-CoA lyase [Spirochaetes bacterium GWB1_59_5]|nr:MAG: hydroxymethylglutaryl-CoA lyase [Spirochaetes bacterium GWB1_59_5]
MSTLSGFVPAWPSRVTVCEVGPRDGIQNEKTLLTVEQKVELIDRISAAGARIIEVGSFVSPKAVPQMADTGEVARRIKRVQGVEYRVLIFNLRGLEQAKTAGLEKAKLTVSVSRTHSLRNAGKTPEDAVKGFADCAEYAVANGITLSGAMPTSFGCPFEGKIPLEQVLSLASRFLEIGVKELSLSDPSGMANPRQVYEYCRLVKERYPDVTWNLHFHNTRGMALANVVAGMLAGIDRFDSSFAGLGGCPFIPDATGNIASEDLIHMCHEMGVETGYDLDQVISVAGYARRLVGHETHSFVLKAGKNSDLVKAQNEAATKK